MQAPDKGEPLVLKEEMNEITHIYDKIAKTLLSIIE